MMTRADKYEHVQTGRPYNETLAILADGRRLNVCVQYDCVMPLGDHAPDCDQLTKMGGRCTCGMLADIDVPAILADARDRGLFGPAPEIKLPVARTLPSDDARGLCPKCHTCCNGDCDA
jgi:hypothetical protein